MQLSETGANSFMSIAGESQPGSYVAPLKQSFNTLLLIMSGEAPHMIRQGEYGEQRIIVVEEQRTNRYEILLDEKRWIDAIQGVGDVNFQAITRGGREMDDILKQQAKTKKNTNDAADSIIDSSRHAGGYAGLAMLGVGLVVKGVSAAMAVEADTRCWQTLPGSIQPVALNLPSGKHKLNIYAFDDYEYSHNKIIEQSIRSDELNVILVFP